MSNITHKMYVIAQKETQSSQLTSLREELNIKFWSWLQFMQTNWNFVQNNNANTFWKYLQLHYDNCTIRPTLSRSTRCFGRFVCPTNKLKSFLLCMARHARNLKHYMHSCFLCSFITLSRQSSTSITEHLLSSHNHYSWVKDEWHCHFWLMKTFALMHPVLRRLMQLVLDHLNLQIQILFHCFCDQCIDLNMLIWTCWSVYSHT